MIDADRQARLKREADHTGASIGELVRRAIDTTYPPNESDRAAAGRRLLAMAAPLGEGREPDWEVQKQEMLDEAADRLTADPGPEA